MTKRYLEPTIHDVFLVNFRRQWLTPPMAFRPDHARRDHVQGSRFPAWQAAASGHSWRWRGGGGGSDNSRARRRPSKQAPPAGRLAPPAVESVQQGICGEKIGASRPVDLSTDLADVRVMACRTERVGSYAERFSDSDVEAMRELDLDSILRFGFGIIKGDVLSVPRWGLVIPSRRRARLPRTAAGVLGACQP